MPSDFTPSYPAAPRDPNAPATLAPTTLKFKHIAGGFGRLWRTFIITVLLSVLTLTIYRFWGLTKIRAHLWSRVTLLDDPFEYTGNGWELFIGFVKVVFLFILPVTLIISGLNFAFQSMGLFTLEQIIGFLTAVGFYWIFEVAVFLRFRYRANRTSWRGIRARVSGRATHFAGRALLLAAGVALTGGLLYPYAHAYFMRYKLNALSFAGLQVRSTFDSGTIYGTFFLCLIMSFILALPLVVLSFVLLLSGSALTSSSLSVIGMENLGTVFGILITPTIFLPLAWYWARFYREAAKSVWIGEEKIDVSYNVTGWRLVRYFCGNWAIIIFSLGLLWPLTWLRKIDLICECLTINKELPLETMTQEAHDPTRVGEELAGGFEIA
jgi:uncharacterized membrane protein YjgN (DUF898 family)